MREIVHPFELRAVVRDLRCGGKSIGLVPTMGALHAGHTALVEQARRDNYCTIMSLFVNPTQFGPNEDFERYPRDLARDREIAAGSGVDILFVPTPKTMYPGPQHVWIDPGALATVLEGARRPRHFVGVCTIVAKLFHLVSPDRAYFGQKDGQQVRVIEAMVRDLGFPIQVKVVPTVRERDGLALSSRNVYLSPTERQEAPALYQALQDAARAVEAGERAPRQLEQLVTHGIAQHTAFGHIDYVSVADLNTLQPCMHMLTDDAILAVAVTFGTTRLIDNLMIRFKNGDVEVV